MKQPFFYSKSSCCLPLPSSHHRRTLLAANDTLFVLIEEDDSNPDEEATLKLLPMQPGGDSAGSSAPTSCHEIVSSHLPLGWTGSTNAPCLLTTSASAPAFYILNDSKKRLLKVDTRLDRESTELQVMQYNAGRRSSHLSPGCYDIFALGIDPDGVTPLVINVLYHDNGHYFIIFRRVILNVERRDACEIKTQCIQSTGLLHENPKYSIVSDGKQKVAVSSAYVIDVFDCFVYTRIYRINIPLWHLPSRPISVTLTMLYGEEWKMMMTEECIDSGKQRAVRLNGQGQEWREIV